MQLYPATFLMLSISAVSLNSVVPVAGSLGDNFGYSHYSPNDGAGAGTGGGHHIRHSDCRNHKNDGEICHRSKGKVCLNSSCESACLRKGLRICHCPNPDDDYCYLCCGNAETSCRPAHHNNIFRPNGERWEKDSCKTCSNKPDGLPCDDMDDKRLCKAGKCTANICMDKEEGEYCDKAKTKICVDGLCKKPCGSNLVCDCDEETNAYQPSDDRCQLCCFDFRNRRCVNAFRKFGISNSAGRPVARTGLSCIGGTACNRYAVCGASAIRPAVTNNIFTYLVTLLVPIVFWNGGCYPNIGSSGSL